MSIDIGGCRESVTRGVRLGVCVCLCISGGDETTSRLFMRVLCCETRSAKPARSASAALSSVFHLSQLFHLTAALPLLTPTVSHLSRLRLLLVPQNSSQASNEIL